jgi:hypothetical protein
MRRLALSLAGIAASVGVLAVFVGPGSRSLEAWNSPLKLLSNNDMTFAFGNDSTAKGKSDPRECRLGLVQGDGSCKTCGDPQITRDIYVNTCCTCGANQTGSCTAGAGADACTGQIRWKGDVSGTDACGGCASTNFTQTSETCQTLKNATGTGCVNTGSPIR